MLGNRSFRKIVRWLQKQFGRVFDFANQDFLAFATAGILFLLPWQTRLIFGAHLLGGQVVPSAIYSVNVVEVLAIAVAVFAWVYNRPKIYDTLTELRLPGLTLLVVLFVSAIISPWSDIAFQHLFHLGVASCVFVLVSMQPRHAKLFILIFCGGLIIPTLLGIFQVIAGSFPGSALFGIAPRAAEQLGDSVMWWRGARVLRAYGSFSHPNIFGGYLSVAILLLLGCWSWWVEKWHRGVRVMLGILGTGLILTYSQAALFGVVVGLCLGWMVQNQTFVMWWRKWGSIMTVLSIGVIMVAFIVTAFVLKDVASASISERVLQWQAYPLVMNWQVPWRWIVGVGAGTYPFAWHIVQGGLDWWLYQPIHNIIALALAEVGVIGFATIMYIFYKIDQKNYAALPGVVARAAFMAGASLCVVALFDHYLWSFWSGLVLVGFVLGLTWRSGSDQQHGRLS